MKNFPWLSIGLLFFAYCVFGWLLSESMPLITTWLSQKATVLELDIDQMFFSILIYVVASIFLLLMVIAVTAPVTLMSIFVEGTFSSDINAFLSIFIWGGVFLLIFLWFEYFIRLLIMLGVIILARIDLINLGMNRLQCFLIIVVVCIAGSLSGFLAFDILGETVTEL